MPMARGAPTPLASSVRMAQLPSTGVDIHSDKTPRCIHSACVCVLISDCCTAVLSPVVGRCATHASPERFFDTTAKVLRCDEQSNKLLPTDSAATPSCRSCSPGQAGATRRLGASCALAPLAEPYTSGPQPSSRILERPIALIHAFKMATVELSQLFVYPVKSCRGVPLQAAVVSPTGACTGSRCRMQPCIATDGSARLSQQQHPAAAAAAAAAGAASLLSSVWRPPTLLRPTARDCVRCAGLLFDRQFVVVKESGGRFLTQRQFPKYAPCWLATARCCLRAACPSPAPHCCGVYKSTRQILLCRMALAEVAIVPGGLLDGSVDLAACPDAALVLNAPGMPELKVCAHVTGIACLLCGPLCARMYG